MTLSGVARPQSQRPYKALLSGWGQTYTIDAPPPGKVLWYSFFFPWQIWDWNSFVPSNNSGSQRRVDFELRWVWQLMAHPYYFPEPIWLTGDSGRYEFYSSVPPGDSGFDASWILPARVATLTADSKQSDPTPLELLLSTKVDGNLHLWWRGDVSDLLIDGKEPHGGYTINGSPGEILWSCAIVPPKIPDFGPTVPPRDVTG
jgi:hypothetical protein